MATAARRGADSLAGVLRAIGYTIAAIVALHVLLTLLDANPQNSFALLVRDVAQYVDLGLDTLFLPADPKLAVVLNYGVVALVWFLATAVVVRLVRRLG